MTSRKEQDENLRLQLQLDLEEEKKEEEEYEQILREEAERLSVRDYQPKVNHTFSIL